MQHDNTFTVDPKVKNYGQRALKDEIDQLLNLSSPGSRHKDVYVSACRMGQLVGSKTLPYNETMDAISSAAMQMGLAFGDGFRQARRGIQFGAQSPRGPQPAVPYTKSIAFEHMARIWDQAITSPALQTTKGHTTLKILSVILNESYKIGTTVIHLSFRRLAELAGVSTQTIHAHIENLSPYITLEVSDRFAKSRTSSTWRIRAQSNTRFLTKYGERVLFDSARPADKPGHNRWHRASLQWRMFRMLSPEDGLTARELADLTGANVGSVRRILKRFEAEGAAQKAWSGWVSNDTYNPTMATDWLAVRQARHALEREFYDTVRRPAIWGQHPWLRHENRRRGRAYLAQRKAERADLAKNLALTAR